MQFFEPKSFLLLWSLPLFAALFWFSYQIRQKRLAKIGNPQTLKTKLMPSYRPEEWRIRAAYLLLVFLFSTLALARPQWGEEKKRIERKGVDIIFLLDTSLSMLAEDIKPSRLEKSKMEIKSFVRNLKGDRIGMVAFAGSSFLQTPLTLDYAAFMLFLDAIKTGYIPDPGTSLDRAIRMAIQSFPPDNMKHRAIILFSDGEDQEGGIEGAVAEAEKAGVRIYTVGVGTATGEPIPLKDDQSRKSGFKKDSAGQVVITKLNQDLMTKIAEQTKGLYLPATPSEQEIPVMMKHMESLGKRQLKEQEINEKEDHFQLFVFLAFLCLVLEMLVRSRKKIPAQQIAGLILCFFMFSGFLETTGGLNEKGNKEYEEKKYQTATTYYRSALVKKPENNTLRYNLGTTLYQTDQYKEAGKELEKAIKEPKDQQLKAQALYNYGNTQYRLGNFEKAIDAYKKVLDINPKDTDAKYNLEFLQKQKDAFEKKNQDRQNQQQQKQKQNQQQNQKNQQQQNQDQKNQQQNQQNQDQNQQNQSQQNQQQQQQNQQNQQQQDQQNQQQQNQNQQDQKDQKDQQNQNQQDQQKQDQQNQQNQNDKKDQQQKDQQQDQQQQDQQQKDQQNKDQQQQNQQNQQNQDQQQQDQQKKDQQDQQKKDQQEQQKKDQEEQQKEQEKKDQEEQQKKDQEEQQKEQEKKDQEEQQKKDQEEQEKQQQEQQKQQGNQDQQKQDENQGQEDQQNQPKPEQGEPRQGGKTPRPLQGQMTMDNALRVLDALKESEKELQDLRRPQLQKEPSKVDKDW